MFTVNDLLPCPFCGSEPIIVHLVHPSGIPGIKCLSCDFIVKADRADKVLGIWNSRKSTKEAELEAQIYAVYEEAILFSKWCDEEGYHWLLKHDIWVNNLLYPGVNFTSEQVYKKWKDESIARD